MNSCTNKKYNFPHKNWLSLLNVHEKQRKKTSRPTYSNLYAYAANNPVCYLDPDGKAIYIWMNEIISQALTNLYNKSETFKKEYDKLLQQKNILNQKFIVLFLVSNNEKYPGNTTTNDSPILSDILVEGINNEGNAIIYEERKTDENIQGIFIIFDLKQIFEKKLDFNTILAEEVCHAADCISYGSEKWNAKCEAEDKYFKYFERPREVKAKELTKKILEELSNEK